MDKIGFLTPEDDELNPIRVNSTIEQDIVPIDSKASNINSPKIPSPKSIGELYDMAYDDQANSIQERIDEMSKRGPLNYLAALSDSMKREEIDKKKEGKLLGISMLAEALSTIGNSFAASKGVTLRPPSQINSAIGYALKNRRETEENNKAYDRLEYQARLQTLQEAANHADRLSGMRGALSQVGLDRAKTKLALDMQEKARALELEKLQNEETWKKLNFGQKEKHHKEDNAAKIRAAGISAGAKGNEKNVSVNGVIMDKDSVPYVASATWRHILQRDPQYAKEILSSLNKGAVPQIKAASMTDNDYKTILGVVAGNPKYKDVVRRISEGSYNPSDYDANYIQEFGKFIGNLPGTELTGSLNIKQLHNNKENTKQVKWEK